VIVLKIMKKVQCAFFSPLELECADYMVKNGGESNYEVIALWNGQQFYGYAVMTKAQYDEYAKYFVDDDIATARYDSVFAYMPDEWGTGKNG